MLTSSGPKIIEYNVRFGDPETQVVVPRLTSSLTELLAGAAAGELTSEPTFDDGAAVTVVAASDGYPGTPRIGEAIRGMDDAIAVPGAAVFGAGVANGPGGELVTGGGRVVNVCGFGADVPAARERAYRALRELSWPGMHFRSDIAAVP
jgi:phosphoribosylamine--glycine ligase